MHRLLRAPLFWMVAAEVVVVATLAGFAWHEVASASAAPPPFVLPAASPATDTAAPSIPADALTPPDPSANPSLPGLNIDPSFWRDRLAGLNEAQVQFEALEWRIIKSAMDAMQRYIDAVVIPAIEHAEKGGPARV